MEKDGVLDSVVNGKTGVFFYEQTSESLKDAILNFDNLDINKNNILIFHTHTCESYTQSDTYKYEPTGNYRTTDLNYSVARVGDELFNYLENYGFTVLKNAPIRLDDYKLILSHIPLPDKQIPKGYINLHGHIHNKNLYDCYEKYEPCNYSLEKHINLSCDVTDFKPVSIYQILNS